MRQMPQITDSSRLCFTSHFYMFNRHVNGRQLALINNRAMHFSTVILSLYCALATAVYLNESAYIIERTLIIFRGYPSFQG